MHPIITLRKALFYYIDLCNFPNVVHISSTMAGYWIVGSKPQETKANLYSSPLIFTQPDLHNPFSLAFAYTSMLFINCILIKIPYFTSSFSFKKYSKMLKKDNVLNRFLSVWIAVLANLHPWKTRWNSSVNSNLWANCK